MWHIVQYVRCIILYAGCISTLVVGIQCGAAQDQDFLNWLRDLWTEASTRGISEPTLKAALSGLRPLPRVLELDRKQPETTLTYKQYLERVLSEARVQKGTRLLNEQRTLLHEISTKYGVPSSVIVALWGIETDFGRTTGGFPVIAALATLAYDGRRSAFFRRELLDALTIVESDHIRPDMMIGSWAGAMGQNQFMPSSFLQYAVDYNGDGRRDIWTTLPDIFASTANYLAQAGWRRGEAWGHRVLLPQGFDATHETQTSRPLAEWQRFGIRRVDGEALPPGQLPASLVLPAGADGPAFLVYPNYQTILKWNRSTYFALTVGQFANRLAKD